MISDWLGQLSDYSSIEQAGTGGYSHGINFDPGHAVESKRFLVEALSLQ